MTTTIRAVRIQDGYVAKVAYLDPETGEKRHHYVGGNPTTKETAVEIGREFIARVNQP